MAYGILTVTKQKQHIMIVLPSEPNKDDLISPESHPARRNWGDISWGRAKIYLLVDESRCDSDINHGLQAQAHSF